MKNIDKTILLAESFGADTSLFISSYVQTVISSPTYASLLENTKWAEKFSLKKSVALVEDVKSLNYDIHSFKDAVVLSSRIDYLYAVSGENVYLNPLAAYTFPIKTKSIGELMCTYNGILQSFNYIISDETNPLSTKGHAISNQCEFYRQELIQRMEFNYDKLRNNKGARTILRRQNAALLLKGLVGLILILGVFYSLVSRREVFTSCYQAFNVSSVFSWGLIVYDAAAALCCIGVILLMGLSDRYLAPYKYFAHYGGRKEGKIEKKISLSAQKMAEYIFTSCKNKTPLKNDIGMFKVTSCLDQEAEAYKEIYSYKNKKAFRFASWLFKVSLILAVCAIIFLVVYYFVKKNIG